MARQDINQPWHDVGDVDQFRTGKFQPANIPGKDVWVLRSPTGKWYAIKNSCPHRPAPICMGSVEGTFIPSGPDELHFGLEYEIIRCPHHAHEFMLETGLPFILGETGRLVRYDVTLDGSRVLVSGKGH
jgi:3-phenylpropionate/trans-cinnamate dioxygenase ferredoxin subunit